MFEAVYEQEPGQIPLLSQRQLIKPLQVTCVSVVTCGHLILPLYREAGNGYCRRDYASEQNQHFCSALLLRFS